MQQDSHYEDHEHRISYGNCEWCDYRYKTSRWTTLVILTIGLLFLLSVFGLRNLLELGLALLFLGWGFIRLREGGLLRRDKQSKSRNINVEKNK